ncbi:MAG: hypothetical protein V4492_07620 [Chlamydiota bacterium]
MYVLTEDQLIICDQELGIDLKAPFNLPRIPLDPSAPEVIREKDTDGNLLSVYLTRDGRRHGQCRKFSEEGKLLAEMFYLHGKLHGPSTFFTAKGETLSKTWYCEGKKWGKAHFYYPSGKISSVQSYKEGEWEGVQYYYYEEGALKCQIPFSAGKLHGEVLLYWEPARGESQGTRKRSVQYEGGLRQGWDRMWNEKGILIDEGQYQKGAPVEIHRHFFSDGKVKEELRYHTPVRFDRKVWDARGKLLSEGVFAPDLTYTEKTYQEPYGAKVRKGVWEDGRIRWK